ncbi:MAG: DUF192 domain-containing protein, partial [Eggerthellaceae bacterium]|nr:DUF192 domain-containing protein [Eggerthellaceae bacterium]
SLTSRTIGLLGASPNISKSVLIMSCKSIHTYGMKASLDVAFIGRNGVVLSSIRNVGPGMKISHRGACCVLERVAQDDAPWLHEGESAFTHIAQADKQKRCSEHVVFPTNANVGIWHRDTHIPKTYLAIPALTYSNRKGVS